MCVVLSSRHRALAGYRQGGTAFDRRQPLPAEPVPRLRLTLLCLWDTVQAVHMWSFVCPFTCARVAGLVLVSFSDEVTKEMSSSLGH